MDKVNGFTIISHKENKRYASEDVAVFTILAAIHRKDEEYEYVTAIWQRGSREWYWGHYFRDIENAVEDYNARN